MTELAYVEVLHLQASTVLTRSLHIFVNMKKPPLQTSVNGSFRKIEVEKKKVMVTQ